MRDVLLATLPGVVVLTAYFGPGTLTNIIFGGLGEAYFKPTSIPQGDPMSMMITSLLLRAWVIQMKDMLSLIHI